MRPPTRAGKGVYQRGHMGPDSKSESAVAVSPSEPSSPAIVGIGASMGGLDALEHLLAALEPGVAPPIVIVLHLDPRHPSMAAQLLSHASHVPVHEARDGVFVQPGHVYVIPP